MKAAVALACASLCTVHGSALVAAVSPTAETVRIGVLAPEGTDIAIRDWAPLLAHLQQQLPGVRLDLRALDLDALRHAVAVDELHFFVANSGLYVELEAAHGASRIATLQAPQVPSPAQAIASAVLVRADRQELQQLADLRGQRVVAVGPGAFGGWQIAWREFQRAGLQPERDFRQLSFAGFPMQNIALAVARGEADAGVVRTCLLESMIASGALAPGTLRVLGPVAGSGLPCHHSTPLYPNWPFAVTRHAPRELAKQVATALLTMPAGPDGIGWTVPADYQPVHELFRELQIGPYAHLRELGPQGLARRYWPWLLAALALLGAGAAHTLRVDVLVLRRTRELRAALAARDAAERAALAQREKLDHLARLSILGEMASMLAHEMSQPLAAIGTYAQGMHRRLAAGRLDAEPLVEASREIGAQAERAREIMERIRAFARKRSERREPVELGAVVDAARKLMADSGSHALPLTLHAAAPAWVVGDQLQLEQVLLNLLKNAHDALAALPPERRQVQVRVERSGRDWRLAVRDNGPGLPAEQAHRLFEPFFTTKPDGLGLGLSICHSIIEAHGGRMWAQPNAPGPGLTVGFDLPAHEAPAANDLTASLHAAE